MVPALKGADKKTIFDIAKETNELAAKCRDRASLKYFGEFANLNFPELKEQYLKELSC